MIERSCLGELVTFVAAQLGLAQALLVDYAGRDQTITNHARELAARLGMRGPVRSDIRIEIIREQWGEVLRLVVSIKAGHVAPSVMLRKIAAYERPNQLDVALQEIGKIERTLFMLDWLENPKLRRRCHAGLNNSEQRHVLTQAIYTFRQGRIIDRSHEAQQYWASGLVLVIAAIIYWNTTYMAKAVKHLRSVGEEVAPGLLAHSSPGSTSHFPETFCGSAQPLPRIARRSFCPAET